MDLREEKGRIQGDCVGHSGKVFLSMVEDDGAKTSRHDSNPLSATNSRGFPVNADCDLDECPMEDRGTQCRMQ